MLRKPYGNLFIKISFDFSFPVCYNIRCWQACRHADIAQLVERLIRNHQVKGSSPFIGSFAEV